MSNIDPELRNTPPSSATPPIKNPKATLLLDPSDQPPATQSFDPGGTVGRYVIDHLIGTGGMANIFLATDPTTERQVAIKVMPFQFNFDEDMRARFQREARVIAGLEHPNIVQVYDVGEDNDLLYIVMRYMSGGSLTQRMNNTIPTEEIVQIGRQIAAALDDVHSKGIIHRDLKPDNILFDADGNAYLSDFGIVKLADSKTQHTATGVIAGTPAYMSPEHIEAKIELDGRSDIYALAVILFEMLSGRAPYVADTPIGLVAQHLFEAVPQIRTLNPGLPMLTQNVIERGMAKDREERYETASALVDDLQSALEGRRVAVRKVKSATGHIRAQVEQERRRMPLLLWLVGVVSICGVAALALLLNQTFNSGINNGPTQTPYIITIIETNAEGRLVTREVVITVTPDPNSTEATTNEVDEPTPTVSSTPGRASTTRAPASVTPPTTQNSTVPPSTDSSSNTAGSTSSGSTTTGSSSSGATTGGSTNTGSTAAGSSTGGATTASTTNTGSTTAGTTDSGTTTTGTTDSGTTTAGTTDTGTSTTGGATTGGNAAGNTAGSNAGGNTTGNANGGNAGGNTTGNPSGGNAGGNFTGNPNGGNTGGNSNGNPNGGNAGGNSNGNPNGGNSNGNSN